MQVPCKKPKSDSTDGGLVAFVACGPRIGKGLVFLEVLAGRLPKPSPKNPVKLGIATKASLQRGPEQVAGQCVYATEEARQPQLVAIFHDGTARAALKSARQLPRAHMHLHGERITRESRIATEQLCYFANERMLGLLGARTRLDKLGANGLERVPEKGAKYGGSRLLGFVEGCVRDG